jgi:hypothetical protein
MARFFLIFLVMTAFWASGCGAPVISQLPQADHDLALDACIFMGYYSPTSAGYVMGTREHFLNAPSPFFRSVREISSLEDSGNCDIAVGISCGSSCWSVNADVYSAKTKEPLMRVNQRGSSAGKKIAASVFAAFREDTPLGLRMMAEKETRAATPKVEPGDQRIPGAPAAAERKSEAPGPKNRSKIAVWDLNAREIKESYGQELTSILVSEISKLGMYEVYSQENVRTLAGWAGERMKLGCSDTQCLTALGQMDIAKLISGSVGKIGSRYSVSLNLFDTQNSKSEKAVSEFGRSEDELIDLVQTAVRKLLGAEAPPAATQERAPAQEPRLSPPPPRAPSKPNISR